MEPTKPKKVKSWNIALISVIIAMVGFGIMAFDTPITRTIGWCMFAVCPLCILIGGIYNLVNKTPTVTKGTQK